MNGMVPPPKNQRWAISTDSLNQLVDIQGITAVNDKKRPTDIVYLVTDEGYPSKFTHFCRH